MSALSRLIEDYASYTIGLKPPQGVLDNLPNTLGGELIELLRRKNGFYAYESALHVFQLGESRVDLVDWNQEGLWKNCYPNDLRNLFCFAENTWGEQFCILGTDVVSFDPETGNITKLAQSIEGWAKMILAEPDYYIGHSLAHAWQEKNRPLKLGMRLVPKTPFVCGGDFEISNFIEMDAVKGMRIRGGLAHQLIGVADGEVIKFEVGNTDDHVSEA